MFDDLLLWCSERGEGTLQAFREAHDWLATRRGGSRVSWAIALSNLQLIGHVEVDWEHQRWAVAPTTLTTMSNAGGLALLVGAQPRYLLRRLDHLERDEDPQVVELASAMIFLPRVTQTSGASARYVAVEDERAVRQLCRHIGIRYGSGVADELVTMLPSLATMLKARPGLSGPAGVDPRRLNESSTSGRLEWEPCDDDSQTGAYEYKRYGVPRYVYRAFGRGFVADKRTVIYAELARTKRHVMRFDAERRELLVPARMQLPLPQGRCAVLKSGLLPRFVGDGDPTRNPVLARCVRYVNIDEPFAQAIASSLAQPLQLIS